jgi:hypothetical protein
MASLGVGLAIGGLVAFPATLAAGRATLGATRALLGAGQASVRARPDAIEGAVKTWEAMDRLGDATPWKYKIGGVLVGKLASFAPRAARWLADKLRSENVPPSGG